MRFAAQRILQIFVGQHVELIQYAIHAGGVDGVELVGRRGDGRETYFVESQVLLQMAEDADHVGNARRERDARRDGPGAMVLDQCAHLGLDNVVAALAVGEDAQMVVHLLGAIHADGDADVVLGEKLDDGRRQQSGVGGETEVDVPPLFGCALVVRTPPLASAAGSSSAFRRRRT